VIISKKMTAYMIAVITAHQKRSSLLMLPRMCRPVALVAQVSGGYARPALYGTGRAMLRSCYLKCSGLDLTTADRVVLVALFNCAERVEQAEQVA
jgi:hypothetical protein